MVDQTLAFISEDDKTLCLYCDVRFSDPIATKRHVVSKHLKKGHSPPAQPMDESDEEVMDYEDQEECYAPKQSVIKKAQLKSAGFVVNLTNVSLTGSQFFFNSSENSTKMTKKKTGALKRKKPAVDSVESDEETAPKRANPPPRPKKTGGAHPADDAHPGGSKLNDDAIPRMGEDLELDDLPLIAEPATLDASKVNSMKSEKLKAFIRNPAEFRFYAQAGIAASEVMWAKENEMRMRPENVAKDTFNNDTYLLVEEFKISERPTLQFYAEQIIEKNQYTGRGKVGRPEQHVADFLLQKRSEREKREVRGSNLSRETAKNKDKLDWLVLLLVQGETTRVVQYLEFLTLKYTGLANTYNVNQGTNPYKGEISENLEEDILIHFFMGLVMNLDQEPITKVQASSVSVQLPEAIDSSVSSAYVLTMKGLYDSH